MTTPRHLPDIDLDFQTTFDPATIFPNITKASMVKGSDLVKHPCGVYFQTIPVDEVTGLAAIPYDVAPNYGFFKIDFLHLGVLNHVSSKSELRRMIATPPKWQLLWDKQQVPKLFQLHRNYELLNRLRPKSVMELADCIAIIRPTKKHLLDEYAKDKYGTRPKLYRGHEDDKSSFKKSHAVAYALTIVIQLHLIELGKI